jgi:hypothetical protein
MPLINTVDTFRKYLRMQFTISELPNMQRADRKYLKPILGNTLYDALQTQVTTGPVTNADLLDICRSYVAPMSVLEDLPLRHVQITQSGLKKATGDNQENVFKWEYNEVRDALQQMAAEALDELWQHLITNAQALSWENPSIYKTQLIKTAKEFSQYYPLLKQVYRLFPQLQINMEHVERTAIDNSIGAAFFASLKALAEPTTEQKQALELLRKAIVLRTMLRVCHHNVVRITAEGISVPLSISDADTKGTQTPPDNFLNLFLMNLQKESDAALDAVKSFLNAKASAELFADYFSSAYYSSPTAAAELIEKRNERPGVYIF